MKTSPGFRFSLIMKMRIKFTIIMLLLMVFATWIWYADGRIADSVASLTSVIDVSSMEPTEAEVVMAAFENIARYERLRILGWFGIPATLVLGIWFAISIPQMGVLIETLKETINIMGRQTHDITCVCLEQVQNSTEQAAAVTQATTSSEEIATSARQISDRAQDVEEVAQDTMKACEGGAKTVGATIEAMQTIKAQVQSIAEAMVELGVNSQKIGGIIEIINEISDQTNLLALNAAIEAAGAGEYGRRFAVVAVEVRRLAERTVEATKEIASLVEQIQSHTNATILKTEEGSRAVGEGARMVNDVGDSFKDLISLIARTTGAARDIHVATKQQTVASEQMADTIVEVKQVGDRVLDGAKLIQGSLKELDEHSTVLMDLVGEVSGMPMRRHSVRPQIAADDTSVEPVDGDRE